MIAAVAGVLLALAAASLGLRTTALVLPPVHPLLRLTMSMIIGSVLVTATLQICDRNGIRDLGLGILISLAPIGVFDLAKWWFRRKR